MAQEQEALGVRKQVIGHAAEDPFAQPGVAIPAGNDQVRARVRRAQLNFGGGSLGSRNDAMGAGRHCVASEALDDAKGSRFGVAVLSLGAHLQHNDIAGAAQEGYGVGESPARLARVLPGDDDGLGRQSPAVRRNDQNRSSTEQHQDPWVAPYAVEVIVAAVRSASYNQVRASGDLGDRSGRRRLQRHPAGREPDRRVRKRRLGGAMAGVDLRPKPGIIIGRREPQPVASGVGRRFNRDAKQAGVQRAGERAGGRQSGAVRRTLVGLHVKVEKGLMEHGFDETDLVQAA